MMQCYAAFLQEELTVEKESTMYCKREKQMAKKIWILLAFHCNCVYVHYVGKEKYLEVPHLIVRNGHLWKVEFGE